MFFFFHFAFEFAFLWSASFIFNPVYNRSLESQNLRLPSGIHAFNTNPVSSSLPPADTSIRLHQMLLG